MDQECIARLEYDQLAMPEGFWHYDSEGERRILCWRIRIPESWRDKRFRDDLRYCGPLYAYMMWTWRWIFTPGVVSGILGFISMLLSTEYPWWVIAVGIVVLLATYWFARPPLSID